MWCGCHLLHMLKFAVILLLAYATTESATTSAATATATTTTTTTTTATATATNLSTTRTTWSMTPQLLPPILNVTSPFAYIQSAFVTGHRGGVISPAGGFVDPTLSRTERLAQLRVYASRNLTSFRGGEIFINTLETAAARSDVRAFNSAVLQVAAETRTPPFLGLWIPSRLPGMWWADNYTQQPASWRAQALMSNGSVWRLYPPAPASGTSILSLTGVDFDLTNTEAHDAVMTGLASTLAAKCNPPDACTGPLVGSYLFSESSLTPPYQPFSTYPYTKRPLFTYGNTSDLQPPGEDGRPPLLRAGNASVMYRDDRVVFSFYQGPKRSVPLFSKSAAAAFSRWCNTSAAAEARNSIRRSRTRYSNNISGGGGDGDGGGDGADIGGGDGGGGDDLQVSSPHAAPLSPVPPPPGTCDHLPADRSEFNDDDASVQLPPHVAWAEPDAPVWPLWEAWIIHTWQSYCERTVRTIAAAQRGNPYFGGAFYFQLAGWYAVRKPRALQPIAYDWRDFNGTLHHERAEIMQDWPQYADLNPVTKGIDLEALLAADWLTGFVHEASHGVPSIGIHPPMVAPRDVRDRYILASDRHRHFVNAQGAIARNLTRKYNKLFGVFARAAYVSDPTFHGPSVADTLDVTGFAQAWNYSTGLLEPDFVATLNAARFVPLNGNTPPLGATFEHLF
eukprot:UC1_evm1s1914